MDRTISSSSPNTAPYDASSPRDDARDGEEGAGAAQAPRRDVTELRGVRTHNLRGIDCEIPHYTITAVTGVSGSGKSSLAFDTMYAEGQRRYTESLSTYARQFIQRMERPPVDLIRHIQPAIALRQKNEISNARSTVGTVTELVDLLQLIFTHIGKTTCADCGLPVRRDTVTSVVEELRALEEGTRLIVVSEVEVPDEEHRPGVLKQFVREGYRRLRADDGSMLEIDEADIEDLLDREVYPVVIDRLVVRDESEDLMRLTEAVEMGFAMGKGRAVIYEYGSEEPPRIFDRAFRCNGCGRDYTPPQPALFSHNSSLGACPECTGFGKTTGLDFKKVVPNPARSLESGAIAPFETRKFKKWKRRMLDACIEQGIPIDLPWRKMTEEHRSFVRDGGKGFKGVRGFFKDLKRKKRKTYIRIFLAKYRGYDRCPTCDGSRLGEEARMVRVEGLRISDIWQMRIEEARAFFDEWELGEEDYARVETLLEEVRHRLAYLDAIGLGYLGIDRQSRTLSGGEMQRIHLTTSLGRALTDTLYVLDEPTAGMHAVDSLRLLEVLRRLRDQGNTVVVVEHDPEIIEGADRILEIGPKGGEQGGELIFSGPYEEFEEAETLTARCIASRELLEAPAYRSEEPSDELVIRGACEHNLDELTVEFPKGRMSVVTGVSGSGKSTLLGKVLFNSWQRRKGRAGVEAGAYEAIEGLDGFSDVVMMSQGSLGRSNRSNALSYTKAYDDVRKLFSRTEQAKLKGMSIGDFSFNTPGGRCDHCEGTGTITVEMHFMADIEVKCEECDGKRFKQKILDIRYRGKSIDEVLEMTVAEGAEFFEYKPLLRRVQPLLDVGLGYIRMGQPTSTYSGGEAQRLKLATYIAEGRRKDDVDPVLFIFDEPTVGLHLHDVTVLVGALRKLIEFGHTVLAIEHNTDFIAMCDHVVDLGPGAGPDGGRLVASGTPEEIAGVEASKTGRFLRELFEQRAGEDAS